MKRTLKPLMAGMAMALLLAGVPGEVEAQDNVIARGFPVARATSGVDGATSEYGGEFDSAEFRLLLTLAPNGEVLWASRESKRLTQTVAGWMTVFTEVETGASIRVLDLLESDPRIAAPQSVLDDMPADFDMEAFRLEGLAGLGVPAWLASYAEEKGIRYLYVESLANGIATHTYYGYMESFQPPAN